MMKFLEKNSTQYPFALLSSIVIVISVFFIFGFFWEDWEGIIIGAGYGLICTPPSHEVLLQDVLFLQFTCMIKLAQYMPSVPVFGIWRLSIIILYISLWFHLSTRVLARKKVESIISYFLSYLLLTAIIVISLVYVNATRDSILLVSAGCLLYIDYYIYSGQRKIPLVFLILLGVSMRVTSGALALSSMVLLSMLLLRDIKRVFYLFLIPGGISIAFLIVTLGFCPPSAAYVREVESYEYPMMGGAVAPLSEMRSAKDSMRYDALVHHFLVSDTAQIGLNFMSRVIDKNRFKRSVINSGDGVHILETLPPLLSEYSLFILSFYALLVILALSLPKSSQSNILWYNIFGWAIILVLAQKITMQQHFFIPWVSMMFGGSLFLALAVDTLFKPWQKLFAFASLILMAATALTNLANHARQERQNNVYAHLYIQKLKQLPQDRIHIILDRNPQLPNEIFLRSELYALKDCIYLSYYTLLFYDFGQSRCVSKLGCSPLDWRSMNIALHTNHSKVDFITEDSSAGFLKTYYKTVYGMDFSLQKQVADGEIASGLFVYHLGISEDISSHADCEGIKSAGSNN